MKKSDYSLRTEYTVARDHAALKHFETRAALQERLTLVPAHVTLPERLPGEVWTDHFAQHQEYVAILAKQITPLLSSEQTRSVAAQVAYLQLETNALWTGLTALLPSVPTAFGVHAGLSLPYPGTFLLIWVLYWIGLYVWQSWTLTQTQQKFYWDLLRTLQVHLRTYYEVRRLVEAP